MTKNEITKIKLAFEYGLVIKNASIELKKKLTPEIIKRAEKMLEKEFSKKDYKTVALEMIPNIISIFEPKD